MGRITITIKTGNAAFEDQAAEVARILSNLAEEIQEGGEVEARTLSDINGNAVGAVKVTR